MEISVYENENCAIDFMLKYGPFWTDTTKRGQLAASGDFSEIYFYVAATAAGTAWTTVDMLSTAISIDSGEYGSVGAATPYVIQTNGNQFVQGGDRIEAVVTQVSSTPPQGLSLATEMTPP